MGILIKTLKFCLKLAIVVAGIAVIVSYARLSEFGDMRKALMDRIENSYAGRLSVEGETSLELSFPPRVSIGDVRIRNADWASRPDMLRAERVVAEIDLLPLVQGQMAVPRLRMIGVDIVVERRADGRTNWDDLNDFETAAGPANPATLPVIFPQIGGTAISVAGGTLTLVDAGAGTETALSLSGAEIETGVGGINPCP